jgi:transcriptional regulator with XRE-family HTH domain
VIRLKFERIQRGLSQAGLAHLARVPQPVICLIEAGKWNPSPAELGALACALGVAPAEALLTPVVVQADGTQRPREAGP